MTDTPGMFRERIRPSSDEMSEDELDECCYLINRLGFSTGDSAECARKIKRLLEEVARLQEKNEFLEEHWKGF